MEWMVLSMLKLARIEAGAIQFEKHPCSLYAIVAQAKESVAYLTEKRGQQIDVQIDEKQMLVCDGDWLTEAIINLLKNAFRRADDDPYLDGRQSDVHAHLCEG